MPSQQRSKDKCKELHFMFNHTKLSKKPKQFLSVTGVTPQQFDSLSKEIHKQYSTIEAKRLSKNRKREIGTGRHFDQFPQRQNSNVSDVLSNVHNI